MKSIRAWMMRLFGVFGSARAERDLSAEIDSHLQLHIDDNLRAGMTPAEARRRALVALGGVEQTKEQYRDRRGLPAFEALVRRHATGLLTFLTRMVGDRHRAEELFQEVFLAVWLKRRQYQHPRPFRPWLYAIALNRCRAVFRLRAPAPVPLSVLPQTEPPDSEAEPQEQAIAAETAEQVGRAVRALAGGAPPAESPTTTDRATTDMRGAALTTAPSS